MSVAEEKPVAESGGLVGRRRRRWSEAQKRQIVAETHEPGVSVPMVAQRYNLNANQIFGWRRLFREPERTAGAGRYVPGRRRGGTRPRRGRGNRCTRHPRMLSWTAHWQRAGLRIVLPGDRRVIVDRSVDGAALARVIAVLERR